MRVRILLVVPSDHQFMSMHVDLFVSSLKKLIKKTQPVKGMFL